MGKLVLMKLLKTTAISFLVAAFAHHNGGAAPLPAAPDTAGLKADFRELGFGMFIHFNMATYVGQQWVEGYPCPSKFDPGGPIDTDAWADAAKAAGMTYGVLTAKHVAGFCLWESSHTEYDIMHPKSPVQEDIVAKFVDSFTSRGLKAGIYYCWRSPGFDDKYKVLPPECDPATHSLEEQVEFQKKQIAELLQKYPRIFYVWNDALDDMIMPAEDALEWTRSLGPKVIACGNWWDWGKKGQPYLDVAITEKRHFPEGHKHVGETCWTLERSWFWEEGFKPTVTAERIAREIRTAHSRNANFLLNVGPDQQGRIVPESLEVLRAIPAALEKAAP